jgi:hypothetical protein
MKYMSCVGEKYLTRDGKLTRSKRQAVKYPSAEDAWYHCEAHGWVGSAVAYEGKRR